MGNKKVFMFSGQGSQYYQMGKELYQNDKSFKYWMDFCNEIATPLLHTSLNKIIYHEDKKGEPFDRLLYTNPALLSIQYSMARMLNDKGIYADYLMGYSLGEIVAAVVSEAIAIEDGLELVVKLAKITEEKTPDAKMLAIVAEKTIVAHDPHLFSNCWITASNFPGNFVICGLSDDIDTIQKELQNQGITTQVLPVNEGFHTPLIDPMEKDFLEEIKNFPKSKAKTPIVSVYKTEVVNEISDKYFWEVIRYPVNFQSAVEKTIENENLTFIDLGPSGSLATSVKYILPPGSLSIPLQILNQFGKNLNMMERLNSSLS